MDKTIAFRKATEAISHMADPAPPWNDILTTARDLVGADAGTLMMFDKSQQLLMLQQVGIDQAVEQEYRQHFYAEDTLAKAAMAGPAGVWLDSTQILPANAMQKNVYHADYLQRSRIGQVLAFVVQKDEFEHTGLSFQRVTAQADATMSLNHGEVAIYLRAFMQELALRRQACLTRLEAIESTFAGLNEATLLVTPHGLIWRLSPLAKELMRAARMISSDGACLTHADPAMAQRLQIALARTSTSGAGTAVSIPLAWGETCKLDISPAHASVKLGNESGMLRHRPVQQMESHQAVRIWGRTIRAISPSVNVQSVPRFLAALPHANAEYRNQGKAIPSVILDCVGSPCSLLMRLHLFQGWSREPCVTRLLP